MRTRPHDRRRATRRREPTRSGWRAHIQKTALAVAGATLLVFGLRAVGVFDPPPAKLDLAAVATASGEVVGTKMPDQGATHIPDGQRVSYNSTPPTSGPHWQTPAAWGAKDNQEPSERTTHNLEHGGIVIAYRPDLAAEDVNRLKSLVRGVSGTYRKIILEPYAQLSDAPIAITAWDWMLKLPAYDETQIVKFIKAHYQSKDAPEPNGP